MNSILSMCDYYEYQGYDYYERKSFQIKWIFILLLATRLPWIFSILEAINFFLNIISIIVGLLTLKNLKKSFLIIYCFISEIIFFISIYDISDLLENGSNFGIELKFRILNTLLFIIWSLLLFYTIKLMFDIFKTEIYAPLFNFSASIDRINEDHFNNNNYIEMIESIKFNNNNNNDNNNINNNNDNNNDNDNNNNNIN
ncbi:hypothetical protein ACTFIT_010715 [Dictyostelium discoideum]